MFSRKTFFMLSVIFFLQSICGLANFVSAQGFIIPRPLPHPHLKAPVLTNHKVDVKITNQVATVVVDQVFYNDSKRAVEGVYYFPLPEKAGISDFKMYADGKTLTGEILEKEKARHIYEDIVRRNIDPALLEYVNHNLFSANIFPIPPKSERKIVLEYSMLLQRDGDLVKFSYPLRGELSPGRGTRPPMPFPPPRSMPLNENRQSNSIEAETVIDQLIVIDLHSEIPLKNIYSPSHDVRISKLNDSHAKVSFEGKRESTSDSFILYYSYSEKDFGMNLLTYHPQGGGDDFFMLLVSPKAEFSIKEIIEKDMLFVIDVSGSMNGKKIEQAKAALKYCINSLDENDRFNIITFSTEAKSFKNMLVKPGSNADDALRFVENIEAKGGTNINDALTKAMAMEFDENRASSIVFLTDGLPTVGEIDINSILKNVTDNNRNGIKIFTFGVGYDVNTVLLDKIASNSRAVSDYVEPNEQIEQKVSAFYDKVSHPVLTDLALNFGRIEVEDIFPKKLPDLFKGAQLTILGRYKNNAKSEVSLVGMAGKKKKKFTYRADFSKKTEEHNFIPYLWAMRKIGFLMDEIRLNGENEELKDEIIRLSKKYGVMSPFTSYLVQEDRQVAHQMLNAVPMSRSGNGKADGFSAFENLSVQSAANAPAMSAKKTSGVYAVKASKESKKMKESSFLTDNENVRRVDGRTFYLTDNIWIDSEFQAQKTIDVKYGSGAYIEILMEFPKLAKIFSLGEKVIFKYNERFIRIGDEGENSFKSDELRSIFRK